MAVRFILGRAGSGKSHYCLESLRQQLALEPIHGPKLILLVPEQATLQTERLLFTPPTLSGSTRGEVLSFHRLAQRLLQSAPRPPARILTTTGRTMILQKLLGELGSELHYFRTARLLPGLYQQLSDQIEEFMTSATSPADLTLEEHTDEPAESLQAKLADLRLIYSRYLEFLQTDFVDPVLFLDQARHIVRTTSWLQDAAIWVDGFSGFTQQELIFLVGLAGHAAQMEISLLLNPAADGVCNDEPPDSFSLFGPTEQTYHTLLAELRDHRIELQAPRLLPDTAKTRFTDRADLNHLETHVFGEIRTYDQPVEHLEVFQAADPRDEINWLVERISELVSRSDDPLRYRDIAIVTRMIDDRHHLIATTLQGQDIPYFIDQRPPLSEHPLYHFLRGLLKVALDDFSIESVRSLLKSDLLGQDPASADRLENYLIAHRIENSRSWTGPDWTRDPMFRSPFDHQEELSEEQELLKQINLKRTTLLEQLSRWVPADKKKLLGNQWAQRLYETLEHLSVARQIEEWATEADRDGLANEALRHRQAWTAIVQLFDDFVMALGENPLTLSEFAAIFEAGLSQVDIGLVPPAVDQIVAGSIERSRHPSIRAVFVLGMNDGTFPLASAEKQLLNDNDRKLLTGAGLKINPPRSARLGEERLLAYIALTRAGDHLFISYCQADLEGHKLEPSPYLVELRRIFLNLQTRHRGNDFASALQGILSANDLSASLCTQLGPTRRCHPNLQNQRGLWNALYDRARQQPELRSSLTRALSSLCYHNTAELTGELIDSLNVTSLRTSTTRLEYYAECPFKYFSSELLRLKPRPTGEVDVLQLGSLYHAILDRFTRSLLKDSIQLADLSEAEMDSRLRECTGIFNQSADISLSSQPATESYLWERLHQELITALIAHRTFQVSGACRTIASELCFGLSDPESLPAFELNTPKGRRIYLCGKIDRVDIAEHPNGQIGFVFDYKRSRSRSLKLSEVYYGLSLQLVVYLLGLEAAGKRLTGHPLIPSGAFYLPLVPDYQKVDHPSKAPNDQLKAYRPRGVFEADYLSVLDRDLTLGSSSVLAARINKDGTPSKTEGNDAATTKDFRLLLYHVKSVVGDLCDRILDGLIPVKPFRLGKQMPCSRCDFRSVCRFEFPESAVRPLESLKKQEVWSKLSDPDRG